MSITGFGFALIAAPMLLFFLEPKAVVITIIIIGPTLAILILRESWNHLRLKQLLLLAIGSILGVPIGAYILSNTPSTLLKPVIAALVVIFAVPLALGYSHRFKEEKIIFSISGFISGILASSASLAGPPVVLLLLNQGWEKESLRATLAAYFLFTGMITLTALSIARVLSSEFVLSAFTYLPAAFFGFFLGRKVIPYLKAEVFRRIAAIIVIMAALVGVLTSLITFL
jgi:uncharacterized membrane protein YfcA